jgi:hypothetical protein
MLIKCHLDSVPKYTQGTLLHISFGSTTRVSHSTIRHGLAKASSLVVYIYY